MGFGANWVWRSLHGTQIPGNPLGPLLLSELQRLRGLKRRR